MPMGLDPEISGRGCRGLEPRNVPLTRPCLARPSLASPHPAAPSRARTSRASRGRRGLAPRCLLVVRLPCFALPCRAPPRLVQPRHATRGRPGLEPGCVPLAHPCHARPHQTLPCPAPPSQAVPRRAAHVQRTARWTESQPPSADEHRSRPQPPGQARPARRPQHPLPGRDHVRCLGHAPHESVLPLAGLVLGEMVADRVGVRGRVGASRRRWGDPGPVRVRGRAVARGPVRGTGGHQRDTSRNDAVFFAATMAASSRVT
jgi:hypothetical protein